MQEKDLTSQRWRLLARFERMLNTPMIILGFVWLVLLIIELTRGLNPSLEIASIVIWVIFILDFIISFILAPAKTVFLKRNVLTIISLIIPAFRVLRVIRLLRVFRSLRLVKVLASLNRSMKSLEAAMSRRAFGYMVLLSVIVILAGAAGMFAFEKDQKHEFRSYSEALWWTTMVVITVGTEYWPKTPEGRLLCLILALYGFAVLGYITATLATFFIGQDAQSEKSPNNLRQIKKELSHIRKLLEERKSDIK